jgi:pyruvate,water dikinase
LNWIAATPSDLFGDRVADGLESLGIARQRCFSIAGDAFSHLLKATGLIAVLKDKLAALDPADPDSVMLTCFSSRSALLKTPFPDDLLGELSSAYESMSRRADLKEALVTVRPLGGSSHEGGRVRGVAAITRAIATCYAEHLTKAVMQDGLCDLEGVLAGTPVMLVGQALGWSCSGQLTTYDPRLGSRDFVVITSAWGLAEDIARKELARDEYVVHKPCLREGFSPLVRRRAGHKEFRLDFDIEAGRMRHSEVPHERRRELTLAPDEALRLARAALLWDDPVEIDWGMEEGWSRQFHLLSVRPGFPPSPPPLKVFRLGATVGPSLVHGRAVGAGLAVGRVRVIENREQLADLLPGEILVTRKTEPDWEPVFRLAGAIVTEQDTRVSHATILARELGIPAVLEATGSSLFLDTGQLVTVCCCQGEVAHVYEGESEYTVEEFDAHRLPELRTTLMVSLSMPERAGVESLRPWAGAGLVRSEFLLSGWVRIHPLALCFPERLTAEVQGTVNRLCRGHASKAEYFVDQMSQGVATIASAFWPRPVILRLSDLKSHEYAKLVGGERFEPSEANPVLGFRGAGRYTDPEYRPAFDLELAAVRRVRVDMGLRNLHLMIPFCRTPGEGEEVLEILAQSGLARGQDGLEVWAMAELPSNVIAADEFAQLFDGLSIGSNDLTQLTLGVDRDNKRVAAQFDEIHPIMMGCYQRLIEAAHRAGKKVSFCGQAASDDPLLAVTLAEMGIDSVSVAPDVFSRTLMSLR